MSDTKQVQSMGAKYFSLGERLLLIPYEKLSRWLDGKTNAAQTPLVVRIMFVLVIGLSLASVYNIGERAYHYHANLFSYITGACFALVVPASVFIAAHLKGMTWEQRSYAWAVATLAALLSAFIQIKLYMVGSGDITFEMIRSGKLDVEALSFSAGIPFYEVLIASLAAMVQSTHERSVADAEQKRIAAQLAEEQAIEEKRIADDEQREKERVIALNAKRDEDAYALKLETERAQQQLNLEIARTRQLALIQAEAQAATITATAQADAVRMSAEAKVERAKRGKTPVESVREPVRKVTESAPPKRSEKKREKQVRLIELYKQTPTLPQAEAGRIMGVGKTTVNDYLTELHSLEVIHRTTDPNDGVTTVTVNGKYDDFLAGRL